MKLLKLRRARRDVIRAAKLVASGHEPHLEYDHDPDDLAELREAVAALRRAESETP